MPDLRKSFGAKIALTCAAVFVCWMTASYFFASRALDRRELSRLESTLSMEAQFTGHLLDEALFHPQNLAQRVELFQKLGKETGSRLTLIASDGTVLADSERSIDQTAEMENHANRPEIREAFEGRRGTRIHFSQTLRKKMMYVAEPYRDQSGKVQAVIRAALPLQSIEEDLSSFGRPLFVGTTAGILFTIAFSYFLSRSVTKSIRSLTRAAESYMKGDFSAKVPVGSRDEIESLARAMNQMASTIQSRLSDLEKERAKLAAILSHMNDAVIAVGGRHEILIWNASAERQFGISREQAIGKTLIELVRNKTLDDLLQASIRSHGYESADVDDVGPDKKIFHALAMGIAHAHDEIAGLLVIRDITEMRRLENLRREFVANTSHELRTPLTSILGFIETLQDGAVEDPVKSREFLKRMDEDARRLLRLIEDLLDLSRIEAKESELQPESLVIAEEVEKASALCSVRIQEKKVRFVNHLLQTKELKVWADPYALNQVLVNLIDNAVKFSHALGEVIIRGERLDQWIQISIEDQGIGIPEEAIPRIFERFFRVDKDRSRAAGGTGLGLSIVKHVVEAHGGKVFCESKLGQGSKFIAAFPAAPAL